MAAVLPDSDSEDELPPGWEERTTVDGSVYYVNHATKGTQWTHPRTGKKKVVSGDLPFGWEKCVSEDGKIFYVDHVNRRTTYTDPRLAFATEEKEHPHDFRQRYDGSTTALQILHGRDLTGKVAVITGANTGIGYETARSLAFHGCIVVFACRSQSRAEAAIAKIQAERPNARCNFIELDLCSLASVKMFVVNFRHIYQSLDYLILNAGIFGLPFSLTGDGYETLFQVNHLSHFYLTLLLLSSLHSSSRVVVVSSESHRSSDLCLNNISQSKLSPSSGSHYWSLMAYNHSKLCNILFANELARRCLDKGVCVNSLHPGNLVSSDLPRHWWFYRLLFTLVRPFTKSLQQAAATTVYCATAPDLDSVSGMYFNNCCRCEPSEAAQDYDLAQELWRISMKMVGDTMGRSAMLLPMRKSPVFEQASSDDETNMGQNL
ncbi:WW domain-containing oxidoreductase isoform X2 [Schistocerca nitens]|uniref:WW domain-containing oxidoreductase isoform X2 n=1 Tax=Schistocerca nitens TaxID=7011 RepID=UPI002118815E|nr:WW domain-containing oxidoreductase isoform X2 [Schistocerca nitens]